MLNKAIGHFCEGAKNLIKEEIFDNKCPKHPFFEIDTICFNHLCRQQRNQFICSCCGRQQQPHASHQKDVKMIYPTQPGFCLINFHNDALLLASIAAQQQKRKEKVAKFKQMMLLTIDEIAKTAENRMECLQDFVEKNGVGKICSRMKRYGDSHADCCLPLLNSLKDLSDEKKPSENSQAYEVVKMHIESQGSIFESQIGFIQQQFTKIIDTIMKGTFVFPPQAQGRMATSVVIPIEQIFADATISIEQAPEVMISDPNEVKRSESSLLKNQEYPKDQQGIRIKIQKQNKNIIKQVKPNKIVKNCNQENKSNPIDLDKEEKQSKEHSQISIINQLIDLPIIKSLSLPTNPQKQDFLSSSQIKIRKYPFGAENTDKGIITIWNISKIEQILKFIFSQRSVTHLVILDRRMWCQKMLLKVIARMPWLEGLHLHCESDLTINVLNSLKVTYFSYFSSYRFINIIDRTKYFPRGRPTALKLSKDCLIHINQSHFRNVFIQSPDCSSIRADTEEVSFVHDESDRMWVFGNGIELNLLRAEKLMVLVFSCILIRPKVDLRPIFQKHRSLHTIVFDDCEARYSEVIGQLRYLLSNQLINFQLSGENLDHKIQLTQTQADIIFSQRALQTLILTSVEFRSTVEKKQLKNSRIFQKIKNLPKLKHLNLYNTEPVYSDFLSYLHGPCIKEIISLNLGCSEINSQAVNLLKKFTNLQELAIDYTEINETDLLNITAKMKNLKFLSVENLNGQPIVYEQGWTSSKKKYGILTSYFFKRLKYKNLRYVNIYNCKQLSDYDWSGYSKLECLRLSKKLIDQNISQQLIEKGVILYIDDAEQEIQAPKQKNDRECSPTPTKTPLKISKQIKQKQKLAKTEPNSEKPSGIALIIDRGAKNQEMDRDLQSKTQISRSQLTARINNDLSSGTQPQPSRQ